MSRPEDKDSASEEAVWLAEDFRKEEYFPEVSKIQFGWDVGERMKLKMAGFAESAVRWESLVLSQYKQSTQVTIKSHLRKHHVPFFGHLQMKDIYPENVQRFVSSANASSKTKKNLFATMQMLWKTARAWGYVAHDAVSDVVL